MIFPDINAPLRNDAEFRAGAYEGHYKQRTIIENVSGLDMIEHFPIGDALHLIDAGVTKRFLQGFITGNLNNYNAKLSSSEISKISDFLALTALPLEVNRQLRGLDEIKFWKATEFRSYLLYVSPVIMEAFFNQQIYEHYMNFYCAIVICSRHDQPTQNYGIARCMLADFLQGIKLLYSLGLFTSNIHNLCHLVDDVEKLGPLDTFTAYSAESKLFQIKRLIRSGNLPLSQVARRITEMQQNLPVKILNQNEQPPFQLRRKINDISNIDVILQTYLKESNMLYELHTYVKLKNFCIDTKRDSDKWILVKFTGQFKIYCIDYIMHEPKNCSIKLFGHTLKTLVDLFSKPVPSSQLQIYKSDLEMEHQSEVFDVDNVYAKLVKIPINLMVASTNTCAFFPLIHTLTHKN